MPPQASGQELERLPLWAPWDFLRHPLLGIQGKLDTPQSRAFPCLQSGGWASGVKHLGCVRVPSHTALTPFCREEGQCQAKSGALIPLTPPSVENRRCLVCLQPTPPFPLWAFHPLCAAQETEQSGKVLEGGQEEGQGSPSFSLQLTA